jgi:hypothetical protein
VVPNSTEGCHKEGAITVDATQPDARIKMEVTPVATSAM